MAATKSKCAISLPGKQTIKNELSNSGFYFIFYGGSGNELFNRHVATRSRPLRDHGDTRHEGMMAEEDRIPGVPQCGRLYPHPFGSCSRPAQSQVLEAAARPRLCLRAHAPLPTLQPHLPPQLLRPCAKPFNKNTETAGREHPFVFSLSIAKKVPTSSLPRLKPNQRGEAQLGANPSACPVRGAGASTRHLFGEKKPQEDERSSAAAGRAGWQARKQRSLEKLCISNWS